LLLSANFEVVVGFFFVGVVCGRLRKEWKKTVRTGREAKSERKVRDAPRRRNFLTFGVGAPLARLSCRSRNR
jgi:hypothetical protein